MVFCLDFTQLNLVLKIVCVSRNGHTAKLNNSILFNFLAYISYTVSRKKTVLNFGNNFAKS